MHPNLFTKEEGLHIQQAQIAQAKRLYAPDVYEAIVAEAAKQNAKLLEYLDDSGYNVWRGDAIACFAANWAARNPPVS